MFIKIKKAGGIGIFALAQFFSLSASAAGITINNLQDINSVILCPIAAAMFWILISVSTIMVLYAAFIYVTAGGDSEKVSKATKTITYAAVGVAAALLAKTFPLIVASIFGASGVSGCS